MKIKLPAQVTAVLVSLTIWAVACRVSGAPESGKDASVVNAGTNSVGKEYTLNAGGPHAFVGARRAPATNSVSIGFHELEGNQAWIKVTNSEPCAVLVWNVRVQVPSKNKGKGTDGFGWDTIHDDYPKGDSRLNSGATGKVLVPIQFEGSWRVCVLFSKEIHGKPEAVSPTQFDGTLEVISAVYPDIDELEKKADAKARKR